MSSDLIAALVGAVVGGLLTMAATLLQSHCDRKRRLAAVKAALSAEIASLVGTARRNGYEAELRALAAQTASRAKGTPLPRFRVAMGAPTFTVYQANANVVGDLPARHAVDVVLFYQKATSWLLSAAFAAETDFPPKDREELSAFYDMLAEQLAELNREGDRLVGELAPAALVSYIQANKD